MGGGGSKTTQPSGSGAKPITADPNLFAAIRKVAALNSNISQPQMLNQQQQQLNTQNSQPNLQTMPNEPQQQNVLASMKDRTLQILYGRFVYLYLSSLPQEQRAQVTKSIQSKGLTDPNIQVDLAKIKELQEFACNPFIDRIIILLISKLQQQKVNFEGFCQALSVFCYDSIPELKRQFLFQIYDKEGKNEIPMIQIRGILTEELFVRTHYSEVQHGVQVKSSYSDRVMREIMDDVMQRFDQDANKTIDYNEFREIISDADVDLMFSLY